MVHQEERACLDLGTTLAPVSFELAGDAGASQGVKSPTAGAETTRHQGEGPHGGDNTPREYTSLVEVEGTAEEAVVVEAIGEEASWVGLGVWEVAFGLAVPVLARWEYHFGFREVVEEVEDRKLVVRGVH